jgi:hypothetical protein
VTDSNKIFQFRSHKLRRNQKRWTMLQNLKTASSTARVVWPTSTPTTDGKDTTHTVLGDEDPGAPGRHAFGSDGCPEHMPLGARVKARQRVVHLHSMWPAQPHQHFSPPNVFLEGRKGKDSCCRPPRPPKRRRACHGFIARQGVHTRPRRTTSHASKYIVCRKWQHTKSTGRPAYKARASPTRAFCPPLRAWPRSPAKNESPLAHNCMSRANPAASTTCGGAVCAI